MNIIMQALAKPIHKGCARCDTIRVKMCLFGPFWGQICPLCLQLWPDPGNLFNFFLCLLGGTESTGALLVHLCTRCLEGYKDDLSCLLSFVINVNSLSHTDLLILRLWLAFDLHCCFFLAVYKIFHTNYTLCIHLSLTVQIQWYWVASIQCIVLKYYRRVVKILRKI